VYPRYQASHRLWVIGVRSSGYSFVTFTDPSGGSSTIPVGTPSTASSRTIIHTETVSSRTASASQWSVTVANAAGAAYSDCVPLTLACIEVPRPELERDANSDGIDLTTLGGGLPILTDTGRSLGGVTTGVTEALTVAKRNGLLFALRDSTSPFSFTTTSYVNPFAFDVPLLDRQLYRSETTRSVKVAAYGVTGATTTMGVRLTMASGATLTLSWAAGDTGSWQNGDLAIHVEDLSVATGIRSATWDTCTIEGKRTTGANAAHLHSVCINGT
jgi:hypothetical protein